jgi:Fe-S-cluster containining protein
MVEGCKVNDRLIERVAEVYAWLDEQVRRCGDLAGTCMACGDCCDFDGFDHRLFITPPELMYLAAHLGPGKIKPMQESRCPYNRDNKCEVYEHRFAACRIFCCRADPDFQSTLSEICLEKFKSTCTDFQIAYVYTDVAEALNHLASV